MLYVKDRLKGTIVHSADVSTAPARGVYIRFFADNAQQVWIVDSVLHDLDNDDVCVTARYLFDDDA